MADMTMDGLSSTLSLTTASLDLWNTTSNDSGLRRLNLYSDAAEIYQEFQPAISIVDKYVTPIWYIVGFPGNIIAFLVWIQPRMRHSSGCYLAALAMADFLFLIMQLFFELQNTWGYKVLEINVICQSFPVFYYSLQYLSPLLVLGFTVERYVSICHPFKREMYCTTSRAIKVTVSLVVFCLALHAVQGYFWIYVPDNDGGGECTPRASVLKGGTKSIWAIWSWVTELLVFALVPLAILALNILVIVEAKKLSDNEEKMMCLKKGSKSSGPSATTFMLLAVSFYLIFTTLPVTICYAMYQTFPMGSMDLTVDEFLQDPTWRRHLKFTSARMLIQELGMSHYACNILIYLLTGKQFRKELCRLLCRGRFDSKRNERLHNLHSMRTDVTNANGSVAHV